MKVEVRYSTFIPNPDKPEKLFLFSTPCVILKKKGVFICYSLINTLIKDRKSTRLNSSHT